MQNTIFVTGSEGGFGRLTAETLAEKGHMVFASMRGVKDNNKAAARELARWAEAENTDLHVIDVDVTDRDSVISAVRAVLDQAGRLDVVINNAGIYGGGIQESFTTEQVRRMFEVNVFGTHRICRAALPAMREQGSGLFVHVSSVFARLHLPFMGLFNAAKAALEGLAETLRFEVHSLGIDSVIVEPGLFFPQTATRSMQGEDLERLEGYGTVLETMHKVFGCFAAYLSGPDSPRPQAVADAISHLIDLPAGQRPTRLVVDPLTGKAAEAINETWVQTHAQVMEQLGLRDLLAVRPGPRGIGSGEPEPRH